MNRILSFFVIFLTISGEADINGSVQFIHSHVATGTTQQDTAKMRQILFNGKIWKNMYHRIEGDQFLFSDFFLPATVSINGHTFSNIRIKYDILEDEIITPVNSEDIVQLNKEMVDSFSIEFENKIYRFIKMPEGTVKDLAGYVNALYNGATSLFIKYKKHIVLSTTNTNDGVFSQTQRVYLVKDSIVFPINKVSDFFDALKEDKSVIRNFMVKNKLKVSKKNPSGYIPVIEYYNSLRH